MEKRVPLLQRICISEALSDKKGVRTLGFKGALHSVQQMQETSIYAFAKRMNNYFERP